ncbi:MAG: MATE family efflux transporter [Pseudomonadota bacterium]
MTDTPAPIAPGAPRPPGLDPARVDLAYVSGHVAALLRLAWPVMLSRAGILLMAFTDIAMLSRYATGAAGEATLGLAVFIPLLVLSIGLASGSVPVIAQADGRGERRETGHAWQRAMVWAIVVSTVGAAITFFSETWLGLLGQAPAQAAAGGEVARMLAPGLVAQVLFAVCAFYLEATRRPLPALVVMAGVNLVNLGLNALLIGGAYGLPEMGAAGAALATTLARFVALGAMLAVIFAQRDARGAGVIDGANGAFWGPGGWHAGWEMRKLGLSAGLSNGFETLGFAVLSLIAGRLGTLALDAYAITHNLVSTAFMVGLGLAVATGVRVGYETGRGRPGEAAAAGWVGIGTALAVMGAIAAVVVAFRPGIAALYTDDPVLAAAVAGLLLYSALVFVPDTLQVVAGQAVRGLGDAWLAIGIYALSFTVLLIPLGWVLAMATPLGVIGLPIAISVVCVLAFLLLAWRFWVLTRRLGRRAAGAAAAAAR